MEDHYLDAANKLTNHPKEELMERLDYQVISTTSVTARKVKRITKKGVDSIYKEYEHLKKVVMEFF